MKRDGRHASVPLFEPLEGRTLFSASAVFAASLDPSASEAGPNSASFFVYQEQSSPAARRVFLQIGGTATAPSLVSVKLKSNDYAASGITINPLNNASGWVDIPAGQTFTLVTITPCDDARVEGLETATFNILPNSNYTVGSPSAVTIDIHDNDFAPLGDSEDAYVQNGSNASKTFGSSKELDVKKSTNKDLNRSSFIKFDLSSVDPLAPIGKVTLNLFGELSSNEAGGVVTNVLGFGNSNWSEKTVTWNTQPTVTGRTLLPPVLSSATINSTTPRWYTFDVTPWVKSALANGDRYITLELSNPADSNALVKFNSREAGSNAPQLVFST